MGVNNVQAEGDLRLRWIPLVFLLDQKLVPSLVLQATAQFLGADLASSDVQVGRAIFLRRHDGRLLRTIPIDDEGRMRVRYQPGPAASWQASFDNVIVYDDEIQQGIKSQQDMHALERRQVWIGRTDSALRERFRTPVGTLSLVEAEMQAERTILDQDYVRPLPPMILAMIYLLVGIGGSALMVRWGPLHSAALAGRDHGVLDRIRAAGLPHLQRDPAAAELRHACLRRLHYGPAGAFLGSRCRGRADGVIALRDQLTELEKGFKAVPSP